jgi:hypothetical protein
MESNPNSNLDKEEDLRYMECGEGVIYGNET